MSQDHLGLFDTPPSRRQIGLGVALTSLLFLAFLLILPVRDVRLRQVDAFVPSIDAVMFVGELITATLLYAQASVFRSRALTVLATGYLYTGLLLVPHALTFPGAFAPNGLLGAGLDTTSWIAMLRRAGFPISIILYVWLKQADQAAPPGAEQPAAGIFLGMFVAIVLAAAVTVLATTGKGLLPHYYANHSDIIHSNALAYESVMAALFCAAMAGLLRTRKSALDVWLLVMFASLLIQSLVIMTLHSRFTAGFYWLYVLMLFSHLVLLLALIAQSTRLHAQLAVASAARSREREARLMSLDALAGAISHEIGQPLTGVRLHASAVLNRLTGAQPDVEGAIKAARYTLEGAQRATEVVGSIRAMFAKRPGLPTEFSLNELVRATTALMDRELDAGKVSLQLELNEPLPPILADRVQIQRVIVNLVTNAIESLGATKGRPRRIAIRSTTVDEHDVLLDVSDNGVGIDPEETAQIFEAFFTTKADGRGLGLPLCRTIVETFGGHLWASNDAEQGATFHLQLPRSRLSVA